MAWGAKDAATQLTAITTAEKFFDDLVSLNPGETAHVEVEANPPATPTDHLKVSVYGTLDTTTESWDETAIMSFTIDKDLADPNKASFLVSGVFKFRVGVVVDGATDTYVADMNHRVNGISL